MAYEDKKFKENDYTRKKFCAPSPHAHKKSNSDSCKICKEKTRRQLLNYMKARTQKTSITEEDEGEETVESGDGSGSDCAKL